MKNTIVSMMLALGAVPAVAQHPSHGGGHGRGHAQEMPSPYAGEEKREIKALSAQEQHALLEGQGQGFARAAELNGYPGPMHVLELATQLGLSPEQHTQARELMARHKAEVRGMGARLVDAERQLDLAFGEKRATSREIERLTGAIGQLQAQIRASHLSTHVDQTELLTSTQVASYNRLRGYSR